MEVTEKPIYKRIAIAIKEFNKSKFNTYSKQVKKIQDLAEDYREFISNLSVKYNVSEKTIYNIIGYRN